MPDEDGKQTNQQTQPGTPSRLLADNMSAISTALRKLAEAAWEDQEERKPLLAVLAGILGGSVLPLVLIGGLLRKNSLHTFTTGIAIYYFVTIIFCGLVTLMFRRKRTLFSFFTGLITSYGILFAIEKWIIGEQANLFTRSAFAQTRGLGVQIASERLIIRHPVPILWPEGQDIDQLRVQGLRAAPNTLPARLTDRGWLFRAPYENADWLPLQPSDVVQLRAGALDVRFHGERASVLCIFGDAEPQVTLQSLFSGRSIGIWVRIYARFVQSVEACETLNLVAAAISPVERGQQAARNRIEAARDQTGGASRQAVAAAALVLLSRPDGSTALSPAEVSYLQALAH